MMGESLYVQVNVAGGVIYAALPGVPTISPTDPEHERLIIAGFTVHAGRIYLAGYLNRVAVANTMGNIEGEWWVNNIHVESSLPASDPNWRLDVVQQGLRLIEGLLPAAQTLVEVPVQAVLNLQSSAEVNPELDFPVGAVHFHRLQDPVDDFRQWVGEPGGLPLFIVTAEPAPAHRQ